MDVMDGWIERWTDDSSPVVVYLFVVRAAAWMMTMMKRTVLRP